MSSFYAVQVVMANRSRKHDWSTVNRALDRVNQDPKTRRFRGESFEYTGSIEKIVASLSRLKDVDRVVVTLVKESSHGVWRRGRKS